MNLDEKGGYYLTFPEFIDAIILNLNSKTAPMRGLVCILVRRRVDRKSTGPIYPNEEQEESTPRVELHRHPPVLERGALILAMRVVAPVAAAPTLGDSHFRTSMDGQRRAAPCRLRSAFTDLAAGYSRRSAPFSWRAGPDQTKGWDDHPNGAAASPDQTETRPRSPSPQADLSELQRGLRSLSTSMARTPSAKSGPRVTSLARANSI